MQRYFSALFATCLLLAAFISAAGAHAAPRTAPFPKPKLVLVIVVDQFRYDYLTRFRAQYMGGLARLLGEGAVFTDARYPQFPTVTATGHATVLTGATPSLGGIISNEWFERAPFIETKVSCPLATPPKSEPATGNHVIESITDESTCLIGGDANKNGASPRRLLVSTLGDELKMARPKTKVFGVSIKDRAAILPSGHIADAAYWFSDGQFATSTYYMQTLPAWVSAFNADKPAERYKDADWVPANAGADAEPLCSMAAGKQVNGHAIRPCKDITLTPFSNAMLEEFAEKLIENENLGNGPETDVLTVSFSANDLAGHVFGPDSPEVKDISIKTDETIGKLLSFVDARLGKGATLVVFTADHGVSPAPKANHERKMPGGWIDPDDVRRAVNAALTEKFGAGEWVEPRANYGAFYLKADVLANKNVAEVLQVAAEATRKVPHVARVYTRDDLKAGYAGADSVSRAVALGFYGPRAGDIIAVPEPYYMFGGKSLSSYQGGTTHLTPYSYDAHVPVIFMGKGIKPGLYDEPVLVNDIAPTLAAFLEVETPSGSIGRVLREIAE